MLMSTGCQNITILVTLFSFMSESSMNKSKTRLSIGYSYIYLSYINVINN